MLAAARSQHARVVPVSAWSGAVSDQPGLVRSAAGVDSEVHELWTEVGQQRLAGAKRIATLLRRKGGLRSGLSVARAGDIIWIYNDPGLHHALVGVRGWQQAKYRDWLAETLRGQLLK